MSGWNRTKIRLAVAFDNNDRFVETTTGKDTLHDIVGILFQTETEETCDDKNIDANVGVSNEDASTSQGGKHGRSFDIVSHELESYTKRPQLIESMLLPLDSPLRLKNRNFVWMLSNYLNISSIPMWVGFNSFLHEDTSPKQIICKQWLMSVEKSAYKYL